MVREESTEEQRSFEGLGIEWSLEWISIPSHRVLQGHRPLHFDIEVCTIQELRQLVIMISSSPAFFLPNTICPSSVNTKPRPIQNPAVSPQHHPALHQSETLRVLLFLEIQVRIKSGRRAAYAHLLLLLLHLDRWFLPLERRSSRTVGLRLLCQSFFLHVEQLGSMFHAFRLLA